MNYSHYQLACFDHIRRRAGHSAWMACPGSGKTTTAIDSLNEVNSVYSVLMAAFGNTIKNELVERTRGKKNVKVMTYNGFGQSILSRAFKFELVENKTEQLFLFVNQGKKDRIFYSFRGPLTRLVSLGKSLNIHSYVDFHNQLDGIVEKYGIDIPDDENFNSIVTEVYRMGMNRRDIIDFDDQKFLPLLLNLAIPVYDQVYIDEFQDTCPVEAALISQAAACGGQIAAIGDPNQAIYGFKGATPDAMDSFIATMGAKRLPLSICYRCPRRVVEKAAAIFPGIESAPNAPEGGVDTISTTEWLNRVAEGDFVVCRTTEPLVRRCLQLLGMGRKATVRGKDLGQSLNYLINTVSGNDSTINLDQFASRLGTYVLKRCERLARFGMEREISRLQDQAASIRAIGSSCCDTVEDLKDKVMSIFTDGGFGIEFMTMHKSKGLQANRVFILRPDLVPHPMCKQPWMLEEENRLLYVAITRAMKELYFVMKEPHER